MSLNRVQFGLALSLALSSPLTASASDEDFSIVQCREIALCRAATGLKVVADKLDAVTDATVRAARDWLTVNPSVVTTDEEIRNRPYQERKVLSAKCIANNSNIDSVCESAYLSEKEIEALHPTTPRLAMDPSITKDNLRREDDGVYQRLSASCGGDKAGAPAQEDCASAITELNDMELTLSKAMAVEAFRKTYPNGMGLRSAELADSLNIPKLSAVRWDPSFSPRAASAAEQARQAIAPDPASATVTPLDLAQLSQGCRDVVVQGINVDVDRHVSEYNAAILKSPIAQASAADLQRWIADIKNTPEVFDTRTYTRYEACIYQARLQQLALWEDSIRKGNADIARLQAELEAGVPGIDPNAPDPVASARASSSDWSGVINTAASVLGAVSQVEDQQVEQAPAPSNNCIGTQAQCDRLTSGVIDEGCPAGTRMVGYADGHNICQ